jgi:fatty-acid desaturase
MISDTMQWQYLYCTEVLHMSHNDTKEILQVVCNGTVQYFLCVIMRHVVCVGHSTVRIAGAGHAAGERVISTGAHD